MPDIDEANLPTPQLTESIEHLHFLESLMLDRQDYYQSDSQY